LTRHGGCVRVGVGVLGEVVGEKEGTTLKRLRLLSITTRSDLNGCQAGEGHVISSVTVLAADSAFVPGVTRWPFSTMVT